MTGMTNVNKRRRQAAALQGLLSSRVLLRAWSIIAAIAIGLLLGSAALLDPDEGRNAEVGREMAETNDYVVPHLDGLPYLDKPIVYFAAEAAAMEILGATELAARLPAYLFTLATAAVIFWFARRLWGIDEACVAVIAFLSMPLTIAFARTVIFDSALTFFMVVAIIAFYFAVESDDRKWSAVAWLSMGIGVLTKGPVALAVPLLVAIPHAVWRKRLAKIWSIAGLILFVVVIAPWVAAVQRVVSDFLRYVLVTETAQRLTTGTLKRTGPPWYFLPYLIGGALPWSIVALRKPRDRDDVFLLLWITIPFLFFSLSQSKRPQYILPLMPAIALFAARSVRMRAAAIVIAALGVIAFAAPRVRMDPAIAAAAKTPAYVLGALLLVAGVVAAIVRRRDVAIIALSLPMIAVPIVTTPLMDAIAQRRSTKSFAVQLEPYLSPHIHVVGVEAFTGSLAFYLERPIVVASDDGEEFTSNYVTRHYPRFSGAPASPLKPTSWLRQTIDGCCAMRLYIVRNNDTTNRALFESRGLRPVATAAHYVAYGPRIGGVNTMAP
jgi:4-amino-4-deoxy-L-arabinose transferase-like glycosyltransferase